MENRICNYRRCNNDITEKRVNAKFCCRNCKDMERTYLKRSKEFIERYKKKEMKEIEMIKYFKNLLEK